MIRLVTLSKGELPTLLLNSGDPLSSLAHFLNSDLQGSPKFTRADFGDQITKIYRQDARAAQHTFEQPCGRHYTFEHRDETRRD